MIEQIEIQKLASKICKQEGKKQQVNRAQILEVLGVLSDLAWKGSGAAVLLCLLSNGKKRAARKLRT